MDQLFRHIGACNNAVLPGRRLRFLVAGEPVGWILPELAERAVAHGAERGDSISVTATGLPGLARALAEEGAFPWRDEAFDVRSDDEEERVLAQVDRGALPKFGIAAMGVHVNGLVGDSVWVGVRAADKLLDPGKLDHLVAGGVPANHSVLQTLEKEGGEEASLPPELMRTARPVAVIRYAMERAEGLRRDVLHCFDLELPPQFTPVPRDGEVERFELWPLGRVLETLQAGDAFKFNVALVLIDLLLRQGVIVGADAARLRHALHGH